MTCHRKSIFKMLLHAHAKSFDALQEEERIKGADARADVAQSFHARFDDEADVAESLPEVHAVVGARGLGELRELAVVPREFAAIDDNAADGGAMAAHEFRE